MLIFALVSLFRSALVFSLLFLLKALSKIFYRPDFAWIGPTPKDPWAGIRLVVFLNHTSLFEPVFLTGVPNRFIWRLAAHGVIPAADKTTDRPLVGIVFRFIAHHVIPISRQRDHTWFAVLERIDPNSMVVIAPEGRMKRETGLDLHGNPMTVRGGVADIMLAIERGRMLLAYSGGLHHVQVPGKLPNVFERVQMRIENLDLADYIAEQMAKSGPDGFKKNVVRDLEARRDRYCVDDPDKTLANSPAAIGSLNRNP